jgi:hypothetical protein
MKGPGFGSLVGELFGTFLGYIAFSAAVAGVVWGWQRYPVSTVVLGTVLGVAAVWLGVRRSKRRSA